MKVLGIVLVALALGTAIVPQFTDCASQGKAITLANGKTVAMKCHWTARAEIAVGAPLVVVGAMLATSRRKESRRNLSIIGLGLGGLAVLLPTSLIGVCTGPTMICHSVMKPVLMSTGGLAAAIGVLGVVMSQRMKEPVA